MPGGVQIVCIFVHQAVVLLAPFITHRCSSSLERPCSAGPLYDGPYLKGTVPSEATCTPSKRMITSSGCRCRAASATGLTARTITPFWPAFIPYDSLSTVRKKLGQRQESTKLQMGEQEGRSQLST